MAELFSSKFGIVLTAEDDWFDPILNSDTELFVDPFLIFFENDPRWEDAHDQLISYFDNCFELIATGRHNRGSLAYQRALALIQFPEPKEFCLGYTAYGIDGSGGGTGYAQLIAEGMEMAIERGLTDLSHFEELGILNEGIGPDRISDLTCNVLMPYFVRYTEEISARHGIATKRFTIEHGLYQAAHSMWQPTQHNLPANPYNETRSILLVPQRFLRRLPTINPLDWWNNHQAEQLRANVNYEVMTRVRKEDIVRAARQRVPEVEAWAVEQESGTPRPYDLKSDPSGLIAWLEATAQYVANTPLRLNVPESEAEFIELVDKIIAQFNHYVEENEGWKLLWNDDGNEKAEDAAQVLFKGIASNYCEANNISLDREVNVGRGAVDFKFSRGQSFRAHLEVKKLHNSRFWNVLPTQLPIYMNAEKCHLGWYVIIQYHENPTSRRWHAEGPDVLKKAADAAGTQIRHSFVDGRSKPTASLPVA
jgi:hypothetical protein